jgi:Tfp pilus assembly protein PilF
MEGKAVFDQANELNAQGKYEEAEEIYDKLLAQNPFNFYIMATLATMFIKTKRVGQAICLLENALKNHTERPSEALCNLGLAYKYAGLKEKGVELLEEAAKSNPSATVLATYGGEFLSRGDATKAIRIQEKAIAKDSLAPLAQWNLSLAYLEDGQFGKGFDLYDGGFGANMRKLQPTDLPYWDGTKGKKVWVFGEQGLGDEIMFASMLDDLKKQNEVVFECHERLETLFKNSFDFPVYGTRNKKERPWLDVEKPDYVCSIGSLGKYFRRERKDFPGTPFLKCDAPKGGRFRVGISWTGGMKAGRILLRTVPLNWWKSILNNDCEFVSLQYTNCSEEIQSVRYLGFKIQEFPEAQADDYNETAKLVKSCDLVISVCTSVIHLAGALGVPCWVMTPATPAWRYLNKGGMPWYRSVRLYRQLDSWIPVVQRVGLDLSDLLDKRKAA